MASLVDALRALTVDFARLCLWLVLLLIVFAPLEKRWALHPRKLFRKEFGTDLFYYFLSGFAPRFFLIAPLTLITASIHRAMPGGFYSHVAALPLWLRFFAAIVVADIGGYWGHRWSHEIPLLWRFHSVHHGPEEIDWLINSHAHPVDMAFTRLCGLVPLYLLGLAQPLGSSLDLVPVLYTVVATAWGFFIHANLRWRLAGLEWLVSSPAFHHWHHANDNADTIDKNYAALLPWLDRCFGTYYMPAQTWPAKYGTDTTLPPTMAGQIFQPFTTGSVRPN